METAYTINNEYYKNEWLDTCIKGMDMSSMQTLYLLYNYEYNNRFNGRNTGVQRYQKCVCGFRFPTIWFLLLNYLFSCSSQIIECTSQIVECTSQSHWMIISKSLNVHLKVIECLSQSHWMFISKSLNVHLKVIECLSQSRWMFISICLWDRSHHI